MRRYETFIIFDPDLSDEQRAPALDRITEQMGQFNGFMVEVDEWGSRKLAYMIKKKARGYYVRLDYCGTNELVGEMERFFRIDDRVIKYMTVLLDKEPDIDAIKEEMAAAEQQKQEAAQAAAAAAAAAAAKSEAAAAAKSEAAAAAKSEAAAAAESEAAAAAESEAAAAAESEAAAATPETVANTPAEAETPAETEAQPAETQKEVE